MEKEVCIKMKTFIKSILAGICISIGGVAYLTLENHIVGACLFTIGLFIIYIFGFNLYTGKVCFISNEKPGFLITVLNVYVGNAVGTIGMGTILRHTRVSKIVEHTRDVVDSKLSDTIFSVFVMGILCGVLICVAVLGFMTIKDSVGKYIALFIPIMVFLLSGYEHSIADMFYFTMAGAWGAKAFLYINIIALGNLVGGMIIPVVTKYTDGLVFQSQSHS